MHPTVYAEHFLLRARGQKRPSATPVRRRPADSTEWPAFWTRAPSWWSQPRGRDGAETGRAAALKIPQEMRPGEMLHAVLSLFLRNHQLHNQRVPEAQNHKYKFRTCAEQTISALLFTTQIDSSYSPLTGCFTRRGTKKHPSYILPHTLSALTQNMHHILLE